MPYTTMSNYEWLFNVDLSSVQGDVTPANLATEAFTRSQMPIDIPNQHSLPEYSSSIPSDPIPAGSEFSTVRGRNSMSTNYSEPSHPSNLNEPIVSPPFTELSSQINGGMGFQNHSMNNSHNSTESGSASDTRKSRGLPNTEMTPSQKFVTVLPADMERPMSMLHRSNNLPVIDEFARNQILNLIDSARPETPDGSCITRDHPLLSLSHLQTYCDLYFTRFNTAYPLLHQATFDASHVDTLLLISVLLVGATYCEKDPHQLAVNR